VSLVLGVDPGLSSLGYAIVDLKADSVVSLGVVRTKKSDKKRKVLASDDNLRRAREVHKALLAAMGATEPLNGDFDVAAICVESMSFPRNSSTAAKIALSWGILASIAEQFGLPIVQASPQEIKKKLCGHADASKEEVEANVRAMYALRADCGLLRDVPKSLREHAWDALSAVAACQDSDVIRMAKRIG
jgi:crossover junction endodeoxyribonuclease RuvC